MKAQARGEVLPKKKTSRSQIPCHLSRGKPPGPHTLEVFPLTQLSPRHSEALFFLGDGGAKLQTPAVAGRGL